MSQTTEQAFADLPRIIGKINRIQSDIKILATEIERLEELKIEILDNTKRAAALKKIFDIHPEHTKIILLNMIKRLIDLKIYLEEHNYL